jgi:DNA primase
VPIFDSTGRKVLGFGGRTLKAESEQDDAQFKSPKYLNSPETTVFQKKTILFGHHLAKEEIQRASKAVPLVIVEGYMDAVALWQAGIKEAVACMGTALTLEQLASAAKMAGTRGGKLRPGCSWIEKSQRVV